MASDTLADLLEDFFAGKEEGGEQAPDLGVGHGRIFVGDLFEHGLFVVQHMVFLVVVADVDIGPETDHARVGGDHFIEDPKDRGFSGAVVADQRHVFAAPDLERDAGKQFFVPVGFGEVIDGEHFSSALNAGRKDQVHVVAQLHRFLQDLRALEDFLAALGALYGFLAVKAAELLDHFLLVADLRLVVRPRTGCSFRFRSRRSS